MPSSIDRKSVASSCFGCDWQQEAEGSDEDIDRAIQRAMQRAIAAEAALAAAVVAGEVDLTAADHREEEEQVQAADVAADDQAGGGRAGVGTRRSSPLPADDAEVCSHLVCCLLHTSLLHSLESSIGLYGILC